MAGGLSCPRCAGLLLPDVDDAAYAKCVACGRSWTPEQVGRPQPVPPSPGPLVGPEPRQEGGTMGKWTPEARAKHQQRMKDIWAKKRTGGGHGSAWRGRGAGMVWRGGLQEAEAGGFDAVRAALPEIATEQYQVSGKNQEGAERERDRLEITGAVGAGLAA